MRISPLPVDEYFRLIERVYIGANEAVANAADRKGRRSVYRMMVTRTGLFSKQCLHCNTCFKGLSLEPERCPFCHQLP